MKLYAIVEGHGEVIALPTLLRRLLHDYAMCYAIQMGKPIRRKAHEFFTQDKLIASINLALAQPECGGIIILLDGEDICPAEMGPTIQGWANNAARGIPCQVVIAYREYETWFLAAIESLRGITGISDDAQPLRDPESKRDAKGELTRLMTGSNHYSPTIHQERLSAAFDLALAYQRSRSFQKLVKAVGDLLIGMQQSPLEWPPTAWQVDTLTT